MSITSAGERACSLAQSPSFSRAVASSSPVGGGLLRDVDCGIVTFGPFSAIPGMFSVVRACCARFKVRRVSSIVVE